MLFRSDIYRTFHVKVAEYTLFSSAHGTFSWIDHLLGHKSSLSKVKKIKIISTILSNPNAMRLEMNYRKKTVKRTNRWRLHNTLLNNQEITEETKEKIKKCLETNDDDPKPMGCSKSSSQREVYSNTILPQETRNISNKQPNTTLKAIRERRTKRPQVTRGKKS